MLLLEHRGRPGSSLPPGMKLDLPSGHGHPVPLTGSCRLPVACLHEHEDEAFCGLSSSPSLISRDPVPWRGECYIMSAGTPSDSTTHHHTRSLQSTVSLVLRVPPMPALPQQHARIDASQRLARHVAVANGCVAAVSRVHHRCTAELQ
jgi:hypothetical protein